MIRKVIIVVLTLAAVGTGLIYCVPTRITVCESTNTHGQEYIVHITAGCIVVDWTDPRHLITMTGVTTIPSRRFAQAPLWVPCVFFAAYPIIAFIRGTLRRRRRRKRGLCLSCGYNLTGLREPRCSECGREFVVTEARDRP